LKPWASAFFVRSVRQEARFISHHVLRAGLAAVILVIFAGHLATDPLSVSAGNTFARTVLYSLYGFITLLGGDYFCAAIVEEKEERTLPLLVLTGASPLAILIGKSGPRLISVLLLVLIATPFLLLSLTLGGLVFRNVLTAILGVLAYSLMLSQLGLFASVISHTLPMAFSRTLVLWGTVEFLPLLGWAVATGTMALSSHANTAAAEEFVASGSLFSAEWLEYALGWLHLNARWLQIVTDELPLFGNLSLYLVGFGNEPIWRPQMTFHLLLAGGFLLVSWLTFQRMTATALTFEADAPRKSTGLTRKTLRVSGQALTWKSWRWLAGGWTWFWFRLLGIPAIVTTASLGIAWAMGESLPLWVLGMILMLFGVVAFVCNFAISLDRLFTTEIQQKTLSSLLQLPISRNALCGQMTLGLVPSIVASMSCLIFGIVLLLWVEPKAVEAAKYAVASGWPYLIAALLATTLYLGLLLSVRMRFGGMLVAIALMWFVFPIVINSLMAIASLAFRPAAIGRWSQTTLPFVLIALQIPAYIWLHRALLSSLDKAGARD